MKKKWIERQQAIVDAARAAGRGLTAEEQAEYDDLQRKIDAEPDLFCTTMLTTFRKSTKRRNTA